MRGGRGGAWGHYHSRHERPQGGNRGNRGQYTQYLVFLRFAGGQSTVRISRVGRGLRRRPPKKDPKASADQPLLAEIGY
jgi:hypothetical protein